MTDPFLPLDEALRAVRVAWSRADAEGVGDDGRSSTQLVDLAQHLSVVQRHLDALQVHVAARIARASRPELGNAGLARQQGFRTPVALIAATGGTSTADAARKVAVGEATAPRVLLTGESVPARHPFVAAAVDAGGIGVNAAAAIVSMLDRVAVRAGAETVAEAERSLVEKAPGLSLEQVQKVVQRAEAWIDPDGVEPREAELRSARALHVREDRSGAVHFTGVLDPESAAPVVTVLDAMVGVEIRRQSSRPTLTAADAASTGIDDDRRTVPQMRADALVVICRHMLGCDDADQPTAGATVVVRVGLDQLESGDGFGVIDGLAQPVSVATVRRMAAGAGAIPCVLGGDGEILDFGRSRRLFSSAQKLALVERDGGCAMCGAPPGMTQVHHILWWRRDAGPTDLENGVLLCTRCHHRIHDDGWTIEVRGRGVRGEVWFTPPAHVDSARAPRLGGRARRDYLVA
jgi:hypothetical protein